MGDLRYVSCLLCIKPYVNSESTNILSPFIFAIVTESPMFTFARSFLLNLFETTLLPHYKSLFSGRQINQDMPFSVAS